MALYEIQKDVPMPSRGNGRTGQGLVHALRAMEIGDSIVVPIKQRGSIAALQRDLIGRKFATRKADANTARVWRIS